MINVIRNHLKSDNLEAILERIATKPPIRGYTHRLLSETIEQIGQKVDQVYKEGKADGKKSAQPSLGRTIEEFVLNPNTGQRVTQNVLSFLGGASVIGLAWWLKVRSN